MPEVLAVQLREGGAWHASFAGNRITACGKLMPIDGWVEYKHPRYTLNESWCRLKPCFERFNQALRSVEL